MQFQTVTVLDTQQFECVLVTRETQQNGNIQEESFQDREWF